MDATQLAAAFATMQQQMQQQQTIMQQQQAAHALEMQTMQQQQQQLLHNQQVAQQAQALVQQQRTPAMRIAPATPFSGNLGTLDEWLSLMTQQFDFYSSSSDSERIRTAAVMLRGAALDWWQQLEQAAVPVTWAAMVAQLRTRFQPIDRAETARIAMYALKQGTSTTADYVGKFRRLLGAVPTMAPDDQLFQFKRGLNEAIAKQLSINGVATLDAAIAMAVRIGAHSASAGHASAAAASAPMELDNIEGLSQPQETDAGADEAPLTRIEVQFQQLLAAMQHERRGAGTGSNGRGAQGAQGPFVSRGLPRVPHLSESQVKERMLSGACFGCGSKDHQSRQCPKRIMKDGRVSWPQGN
jgi:hypothetical protein